MMEMLARQVARTPREVGIDAVEPFGETIALCIMKGQRAHVFVSIHAGDREAHDTRGQTKAGSAYTTAEVADAFARARGNGRRKHHGVQTCAKPLPGL